MTDAYQNRISTAVPRLLYGAIGLGSFHCAVPSQIAPPVESMLFEAAGR
jgi:hypothetical protein